MLLQRVYYVRRRLSVQSVDLEKVTENSQPWPNSCGACIRIYRTLLVAMVDQVLHVIVEALSVNLHELSWHVVHWLTNRAMSVAIFGQNTTFARRMQTLIPIWLECDLLRMSDLAAAGTSSRKPLNMKSFSTASSSQNEKKISQFFWEACRHVWPSDLYLFF